MFCRASERRFTRGYEDRHRASPGSFPLVEAYITRLCSNLDIDKIAPKLRLLNRLIVILACSFH